LEATAVALFGETVWDFLHGTTMRKRNADSVVPKGKFAADRVTKISHGGRLRL
jgi:hypothetical protein